LRPHRRDGEQRQRETIASLIAASFYLDFHEILQASSVSAQRDDASMSSQYRLSSLAPTSALNGLSVRSAPHHRLAASVFV